ncbi:MAG: hypothetical protein AAFR15_09970 [Cyanobacteria bacterium J06627_15]
MGRSLLMRAAGVAVLGVAIATPAQTFETPAVVCSYNPDSERPNPLGMRAFVQLRQYADRTTVTYEQFPATVSGPAEIPATIELVRTLTFYNVDTDTARQLLLSESTYYEELLGESAPEGFGPVDQVLVCRTVDASPPPEVSDPMPPAEAPPEATPGPIPTIASLPDGNYRYWSAESDLRIVTEDELLSQGGALFLFKKTGDQIIGEFGYIDGLGLCVSGRVSGNTILGRAVSDAPGAVTVQNTFEPWGPAGFLQVLSSEREGNLTRYRGALLTLDGFSRINAGTRLPLESCP